MKNQVLKNHLPNFGQSLKFRTSTSSDNLAWGAEDGVDDKVVNERQVVEERNVIASQLKTLHQKLKSLAGDLAVARMNE